MMNNWIEEYVNITMPYSHKGITSYRDDLGSWRMELYTSLEGIPTLAIEPKSQADLERLKDMLQADEYRDTSETVILFDEDRTEIQVNRLAFALNEQDRAQSICYKLQTVIPHFSEIVSKMNESDILPFRLVALDELDDVDNTYNSDASDSYRMS